MFDKATGLMFGGPEADILSVTNKRHGCRNHIIFQRMINRRMDA